MAEPASTIHASAVLIGAKAVLIRGPAGSGKSRLVLDVLHACAQGALPFARLIADDRAYVEASGGRLLVRPPQKLAGLIEVRGIGIRRLPYEPVAVVALVVDLAERGQRLPEPPEAEAVIAGVRLPRLCIPTESDPLPVLLAYFGTWPAGI